VMWRLKSPIIIPTLICASLLSSCLISCCYGFEIIDLEQDKLSTGYINKNQWLYFRVRKLITPTNSIKVTSSACRGLINLYVKYCNPFESDCEQEFEYIPTPENSDYVYLSKSTTGEEDIENICFVSEDGTCESNVYYYIGINAVVDNTHVEVLLEIFPQGTAPVSYQMDTTLDIDMDTGKVNWPYAMYCSQGLDKTCVQKLPVPNAQYQLYYSEVSTGANMGTICGMNYYGNPVGLNDSSVAEQLSGIHADISYNINVVMTGSNQMKRAYKWSTVTFEQDIGVGGLGVGWVALIVICVLMVVILLAVAGFTIWKRKRSYSQLV